MSEQRTAYDYEELTQQITKKRRGRARAAWLIILSAVTVVIVAALYYNNILLVLFNQGSLEFKDTESILLYLERNSKNYDIIEDGKDDNKITYKTKNDRGQVSITTKKTAKKATKNNQTNDAQAKESQVEINQPEITEIQKIEINIDSAKFSGYNISQIKETAEDIAKPVMTNKNILALEAAAIKIVASPPDFTGDVEFSHTVGDIKFDIYKKITEDNIKIIIQP